MIQTSPHQSRQDTKSQRRKLWANMLPLMQSGWPLNLVLWKLIILAVTSPSRNGKPALALRVTWSQTILMILERFDTCLTNRLHCALANACKVIVEQLALEVAGRPDVVLDVWEFQSSQTNFVKLTSPGALENLKQKPFIIKEGVEYRYLDH